MWDILLPKPQQQDSSIPEHSKSQTPVLRYNPQASHINVILRYDQDKHDLIAFLHAACFAPVKSTFLKAIQNNHFTTWPGLSVQAVKKHLIEPPATAQGHIKQEFQGLRNTKRAPEQQPSNNEDMFPSQPQPPTKTHEVMNSLTTAEGQSIAYSDLTRRFPYTSSRGNQYIMVAYHYDVNAILVEPIKNRNSQTLVQAWKKT